MGRVTQVSNDNKTPGRMFKKAVQQGRSERRGESYSGLYGESLSDARTKLADFFNIRLLLGMLLGEIDGRLSAAGNL